MVKTKNTHKRSLGVRSLSVILSLVLVLSTCVVMLTASMFSADAAIDYWFVSGNFNNWTQEATSTNKINGSSGSVTIQMNASSIKFKMIAQEDGNKWCGNSDGTLTVGTRKELSWNGGKDIVCALPDNTVAVTFKVDVESGKNYITVTAKTSGGSGGGGTSPTKYTTTVKPDNPNNKTHNGLDSGSPIFWVDATYYDYLSDAETKTGGSWLYPDHVGTSNFNGNKDEWYPFNNFNKNVIKPVADANSAWSKPLYFGNFCNTYNAYDTSHHPGVTNGYTTSTGSSYVTRFNYAANNSNGVYDRNTSVQGLMGNSLQYSQLQTPDGTLAPYFDESALGNNAKIIKSSFPFRTTDYGTYKRYEFDSTNAKDNVFFTWETQDGVSYPKYVNYGNGTNYGVKDGLKEFMNTSSGYGIFPFNNANTTEANQYKGTKTKTNEQLDYGFGIRMDMKFRIPENTKVSFDFSGDDDLWMYVTDETTKQSTLALDMGGSHKESEGRVNFYKETGGVVDFTTAQGIVDKVDYPSDSNKDIFIHDYSNWGAAYIWAWGGEGADGWYEGDGSSNLYRFRDNLIGSNGVALSKKTNFKFCKSKDWNINNQSGNSSGELSLSDYQGKNTYTNNMSYKDSVNVVGGHCRTVKKDFAFNPDHTYTMTIFYMERGLIESNCKMGFTITPLGNNFIVTERINTTNINPGLQTKVMGLSEFGFRPYNNNTQLSSDTGYRTFTLGNGGYTEIPKTALPINSKVKIEQYATKNSYLTYNTEWDYIDNENGMRQFTTGGSGTGITSGSQTTTTATHTLINVSGDPYDYAELQVDYENTPQSTDVTVTKTTTDGSNKEFDATVYLALDYDNSGNPIYSTYKLEYTDNKSSGTHTANGGRVKLQNGKTITFNGIPKGARMYVVEDADSAYTPEYSHSADSPAIVGTNNNLTITNKPNNGDASLSAIKTLDGKNYSGSMFKFSVQGIEVSDVSTKTDTTDYDDVTTISNGSVNFSLENLQQGTYCYVMKEEPINTGNSQVDGEISVNPNKQYILAKVVMAVSGGQLRPTVTYYKANQSIYGQNPFSGEWEYSVAKSDFADSKKLSTTPTFENNIVKPYIQINKKDQTNATVTSPAKFAVYKVANNGADYETGTLVEEKSTVDGMVKFENLDLYKAGYENAATASALKYQWYVVVETQAPNGHNPSTEPIYVQFPINGDEGLTYHAVYDYQNGKLVNPQTAGWGNGIFKTVGWSVAGFAVFMLAAYVLMNKKSKKRAKHYIKK